MWHKSVGEISVTMRQPAASGAPARYRLAVLREPVAGAWLLPFVYAGAVCLIGGGLLAAATAYVTTQKTAWATAYLVLVGGVAQVALGAAVVWLRPDAQRRWGWIAFAGWNLGNACVLAGQLAAVVVLTDLGSVLLVVALAVILVSTVRRSPERGAASYQPVAEHRAVRHPVLLWAFRVLIVILLAGIVVGTALAHLGS
jgi:hypothetical protein